MFVAIEAAINLTLNVLNRLPTHIIVIQVKKNIFIINFVKNKGQRWPAPMPCGWMDAKHVCVLMKAMRPGAMATEVIIMIITLRPMESIHGVIPIGETGNATPSFYQRRLNAIQVGSVLMD